MGHSLEFTILDYKEIFKLFLKIKHCTVYACHYTPGGIPESQSVQAQPQACSPFSPASYTAHTFPAVSKFKMGAVVAVCRLPFPGHHASRCCLLRRGLGSHSSEPCRRTRTASMGRASDQGGGFLAQNMPPTLWTQLVL